MSNETKNLEELAQPVGFVSKIAAELLELGDVASIRPFYDVQGSKPLYSQEYVDALRAEILALNIHAGQQQSVAANNLDMFRKAEQTLEREREKSRRVMSENQQQAQRIEELESDSRLEYTRRVERENAELRRALGYEQCQRVAELEAKLSEMTTFRDNAVKKNERRWEELLELRAKLATPVRLPVVGESGSSLQLRGLIRQRHAKWSEETFGNVGPVGPLKHLSKEALEAAAEPDDLSEWADIQFLMWDAQRRAGISDAEITAAMEEKLKVNMAREWPEPKDGEPRLHITTPPAPAAPE